METVYLLRYKDGSWVATDKKDHPYAVDSIRKAEMFVSIHRAESYRSHFKDLELWEVSLDPKKTTEAPTHSDLKEITGKLFHYTEMGDISAFVLYADDRKGYDATFDIDDAEELTIYTPDKSKVLWSGDPRGKNRKAIMLLDCRGHVPEAFPTDRAKDWGMWVALQYPATIKTKSLSWGEKAIAEHYRSGRLKP